MKTTKMQTKVLTIWMSRKKQGCARDEAVDELLKMSDQTENDIVGEQAHKSDESADYNDDIDEDEPDLKHN